MQRLLAAKRQFPSARRISNGSGVILHIRMWLIAFLRVPVGCCTTFLRVPIGSCAAFLCPPVGCCAAFLCLPVGRCPAFLRIPVGCSATFLRAPVGCCTAFLRVPVGRPTAFLCIPVGRCPAVLRIPVGCCATFLRVPIGRPTAFLRVPVGRCPAFLCIPVENGGLLSNMLSISSAGSRAHFVSRQSGMISRAGRKRIERRSTCKHCRRALSAVTESLLRCRTRRAGGERGNRPARCHVPTCNPSLPVLGRFRPRALMHWPRPFLCTGECCGRIRKGWLRRAALCAMSLICFRTGRSRSHCVNARLERSFLSLASRGERLLVVSFPRTTTIGIGLESRRCFAMHCIYNACRYILCIRLSFVVSWCGGISALSCGPSFAPSCGLWGVSISAKRYITARLRCLCAQRALRQWLIVRWRGSLDGARPAFEIEKVVGQRVWRRGTMSRARKCSVEKMFRRGGRGLLPDRVK
mmetsp:Transcript_14659/g.46732  ORF Transcript_14659/g.46732 Transcript_14659/m.46732 type:complete len:467 (-) Transcript_14659:517-1917(-)